MAMDKGGNPANGASVRVECDNCHLCGRNTGMVFRLRADAVMLLATRARSKDQPQQAPDGCARLRRRRA